MFQNKPKEEILFCKELPGKTTAAEIFKLLNDFIVSHSLDWQNCIGICTDGATAMTGRRRGVVTRVHKVAPNITGTHCMLHRQALAIEDMNEELHSVLNYVVKIVDFVKANPLNTRLFRILCEEKGTGHENVLLHFEVRWLSKGRVVKRAYELRGRKKLKEFLQQRGSPLPEHLTDFLFISRLAYLADKFHEGNELKSAPQGHGTCACIRRGQSASFPEKTQHLAEANE